MALPCHGPDRPPPNGRPLVPHGALGVVPGDAVSAKESTEAESLLGAEPGRGAFFDIHEESSDGSRGLWFLEQLLEGRRMAIWDNGRIHRSAEVKTFLQEHRNRLETRRFPPYPPELGPYEWGPSSSIRGWRTGARRGRKRFESE